MKGRTKDNFNKKNIKSLLIVTLTIVLCLLMMSLLGIYLSPNENSKSTKFFNDIVDYSGYTTEVPDNFEPTMVLNKYLGAQCVFDEATNDIAFELPSSYNGQVSSATTNEWTTADNKVFQLNSNNSQNCTLIELDYNDSLTLEINNDNGCIDSFEMKAPKKLYEHVARNATYVKSVNNVKAENTIAFYDAQINTINTDGTRNIEYNVSADCWYHFTQPEIEEIRKYTDSRENKVKFRAVSENITKMHNGYFGTYSLMEITKFLPEEALYIPGKSAFIGTELGYVLKTHDNRKLSYGDGKYYREILRENAAPKQVEYKFDPNDCDLRVDYFLIFAIDRELVGREYHTKITPILRASSGYFIAKTERGKFEKYHQIDTDYSNIYLSDPIMSLSINNAYDVNEFDDGYNQESVENEIGVSQVRVNYNGRSGDKEHKEDWNVDKVCASILSVTKDVWDMGKSIKGLKDHNAGYTDKKDDSKVKKFFKDAFGDVVEAGLDIASELNPYIAVGKAVYSFGKKIYDIIDSRRTVFRDISANNEENILTFPAPSQKLVKRAFVLFDQISSDEKDAGKTQEKVLFKDGNVKAKFVMDEFDHYVESIFMLTEVNKPITISSFVNPTFAFDYSGSFGSNVKKYSIPDEYNFSAKTSIFFEKAAGEVVKENQPKKVTFFGTNKRDLQLAVTEPGDYDLFFDNIKITSKVRLNYVEQINEIDISDEEKQRIYGEYYYSQPSSIGNRTLSLSTDNKAKISDDNNVYGLYLTPDTDLHCFIIADEYKDDYNTKLKNYTEEPIGASFIVTLKRHYDTMPENGTEINLGPNSSITYLYSTNETLAKNLSLSDDNLFFDISTEKFVDIIPNQQNADMLFWGGNKYYITVHNTSDKCINSELTISSNKSFTDGIVEDDDFLPNYRVYTVNITRGGIYTFDYPAGTTVQVKDINGAEKLYGHQKAVLSRGKYYVSVISAHTDDAAISMKFTPRSVFLEQTTDTVGENFFTFTSKLAGNYTFEVDNPNYSVSIDGKTADENSMFSLEANKSYILSINTMDTNVKMTPRFTPQKVGINSEFTSTTVELEIPITGSYFIEGDNVVLYDECLNVIKDGNVVNQLLFADTKYFVTQKADQKIIAKLVCDVLTVNNEINIGKTAGRYFIFKSPERGTYIAKSVKNVSQFEFYASKDLPATKLDPDSSSNAYLLEKGEYYIKVTCSANDTISINNADIKDKPALSVNQLKTVTLTQGDEYAKVYSFTVDKNATDKNGKNTNSIEYEVLLEHSIYANVKIKINDTDYIVPDNSRLYKERIEFKKGQTYKISIYLESEGTSSVTFGIMPLIPNYSVYVSNRLQNSSGTVNKIAVKDYAGYVTEKITVNNSNGFIPLFSIVNTPQINGIEAVSVSEDGVVTVNNDLPQWTAFSVLINIGRVEDSGVIFDEGEYYIVNFLVYVDIEDIAIFDENDVSVYSLDIEPKQTVNLVAKVFPNYAAEAKNLSYKVIEGSEYIDYVVNSNNVMSVTARYTAPIGSLIKISASCGDNFKVTVLLRVNCEQIYINSSTDSAKFSKATGTAYELFVNNDCLFSNSSERILSIPQQIRYLKINAGSINSINTCLEIKSNELTLILNSITVRGIPTSQDKSFGAIFANGFSLDLHFIGGVKIYGADGQSDDEPNGSIAIKANNLRITNETLDSISYIYGGNGTYGKASGGNGGVAIAIDNCLTIINSTKIVITGGTGGNGYDGKSGSGVTPGKGKNGGDGIDGIEGNNGGEGGVAISCKELKIIQSSEISIVGGTGGNGGNGGDGSSGGNGSKGDPSNYCDATQGGKGGNGGSGGNGGNGGNGSIAVVGSISVNNSLDIALGAGDGGNAGSGGNAGNAGNGGNGGDGGDDETLIGQEAAGGNGGNGGNGGQAGKIGSKGEDLASINKTNSSVTTIAAADGQEGFEGFKGYGGRGGKKGDDGGYDAGVSTRAAPGSDGTGRDKS